METTIAGNGWTMTTHGETAWFRYLTEEITISSADFPKGKSISDLRIICTKHRADDIRSVINRLNHWFGY